MQQRQSSTAAWHALCAAAASVLLFGAVAYLFKPAAAAAAPAQFFLSGPHPLRCASCGWIEAKRELAPLLYEYTLRMPDGSMSVFQETLPMNWRVGERIMLIEASGALE
jgi:hypothetical protein